MRGVLALALLSSATAVAQADAVCGAAVRLHGDPATRGPLEAELVRRGIDVDPPWNCDGVRALVSTDADGRLRVAIADREGHVTERAVSGLLVAAALIESWARPELELPLLARPAPVDEGGAPLPAATPAPLTEEPPRSMEPPPLRPDVERRFQETPATPRLPFELDVDGEMALGPAQQGFGVLASGCFEYGPFCLGGAARVSALAGAGPDFSPDTNWLGVDGLATAGLPLRLTSWTFTPSLGVGAGWLSTTQGSSAGSVTACGGSGAAPSSGGTTGGSFSCTPSSSGASPFRSDTAEPRLEAAATLALYVADHWALRARASVTVSPWAHTAPALTSPLSPSQAVVLGEPVWLGRLGVGVQWGRP